MNTNDRKKKRKEIFYAECQALELDGWKLKNYRRCYSQMTEHAIYERDGKTKAVGVDVEVS